MAIDDAQFRNILDILENNSIIIKEIEKEKYNIEINGHEFQDIDKDTLFNLLGC